MGGDVWSVVLVNFHDVNIPTVAGFNGLTTSLQDSLKFNDWLSWGGGGLPEEHHW